MVFISVRNVNVMFLLVVNVVKIFQKVIVETGMKNKNFTI